MIVCHCEAVNDRAVEAAVLAGAESIDDLGDRCRAGITCGGCHRTLERLLDEIPSEAPVAAVA